ncbi:response regulator [Chelativorans sp. AA-79]|uniref:response regulator n=1 Tax=Chelativorans sp. AA-79 TaxID=3028735 RepID=UPI0023F95A47|nr:response regulator [Chelativorans sp. AA-79]WEX12095.1 response regulator [Chelativorans sp. AA-79]
MSAGEDKSNTILIAEDEALVRMAIADHVRSCGFKVLEASSAAAAIAALNSDPSVRLVFSDIQMPGDMNGFSLAAWIREHFPAVKIILTSGFYDGMENAAALCDEGPLPKPYDEGFVVERIRYWLGPEQQQREIRV